MAEVEDTEAAAAVGLQEAAVAGMEALAAAVAGLVALSSAVAAAAGHRAALVAGRQAAAAADGIKLISINFKHSKDTSIIQFRTQIQHQHSTLNNVYNRQTNLFISSSTKNIERHSH